MTRSKEIKPRYDLIPIEGLEEVARRFALGLKNYGKNDWMTGDKDWLDDRFNHAVEHLFKFTQGQDSEIENLAAVGWFAIMRIWYLKKKKM